jgi:hypothetical protein
MESVMIERFLAGNGNGNGDGYGYGNGDGNGYGYGNGNGYGYGYGNGDGYGNGYGDGYGNGYGNGNGNGYGYGNGNGNGNGNGYGNGNGNGYGYGNGITLKTYRENTVYYVDTLPCVFKSIKGDVAMVDVIDANSFLSTSMFVAKHGGLFAHGKTIKEAVEAVQEKWAENQSLEDRIEEFKRQFKKGVSYDAKLFYKWHTILTGSCQAGKDFWIKQQGIDLEKPMTVNQFLDLTKNAYGAESIRKLIHHYEAKTKNKP